MTSYYVAVRVNGRDLEGNSSEGWLDAISDPKLVMSGRCEPLMATVDITRHKQSAWPVRLLAVQPVGDVDEVDEYRCSAAGWTVLDELPGHLALGEGGARAEALVDAAAEMTSSQALALCLNPLSERVPSTHEEIAQLIHPGTEHRYGDSSRPRVAALQGVDVYLRANLGWDYPSGADAATRAFAAVLALVAPDVLGPERCAAMSAPWVRVMGDSVGASGAQKSSGA